MFNDRRSKRMIFMAHCRLNQNAISDGSLGAVRPVVENTRIRRAIRRHPAALRMEELVRQVVHQISEHRRNGFDVVGIVGMVCSPCYGVNTTSDEGRELAGQGILIAAIQPALAEAELRVSVIGVKAANAAGRGRVLLDTAQAAE